MSVTCLLKVSMCIIKGNKIPFDFTFTDEDGDAIDISNTTLKFTAKTYEDDADVDAILTKSVTFPADSNSIAGLGSMTLTHDDTKDLVPKAQLFYDFQWIGPDGEPVTVQYGKLKVIANVLFAPI